MEISAIYLQMDFEGGTEEKFTPSPAGNVYYSSHTKSWYHRPYLKYLEKNRAQIEALLGKPFKIRE